MTTIMWSALQQICRFDKLLAASDNEVIQTTQIIHHNPSKSIEIYTNNIDLPFLPEDVLATIFACCEVRDLLLGVALVSRKWRDIVSSGRVFLLEEWYSVPRDSSKWISEGKYYLKKKMWTPSITSFSRAIVLNPKDGNSFSYRATAYQKKGLYEEALKDFKKVLELNPKDASVVYNNRGFLYNKMGRYEDAMKENTKAIDIDPNDDIAYNNRGFAFNSLGRFPEALYDYTKAIELDNMYSIAYNNRGYAFNSMGRFEEALGDYNKALELDTEDSIAVNLKAALLRRMETVKKAKEEFIKQRSEFTRTRRDSMSSMNSCIAIKCSM